ncbi:TLC domain-containing protein 2-like [Acanthaster planci]|uniref:TLC domain-containing protein 2-like n=1 Tax=Acanthaster planci TaxID=133434 RepID=A0A8B7ZK76_ACAPL|nr:TLC domain-containing protein 2-like [Acanthaster planci]
MSGLFVTVAAAAAVGYKGFNSALDQGLVPQPPGKYASTDRHRWRNAATSCLNAAVVSVLTLHCLFSYPDAWHSPHSHYSELAEASLAVMTGYVIYDTWDIIMHTGLFKQWTVLLHHVIVGLVFYMLSRDRVEFGSGMIALLTEVNAVFLHSRQLLLIYGFSKSSPIYRVHRAFNLATGLFFRLVPVAYVFFMSFFIGGRGHASVALQTLLPLLTFSALVMNCMMLMRLLRSDFFSTKTDKVDFILEN